jgi:uncharacterized membrane protein YecN with MAPEG domain
MPEAAPSAHAVALWTGLHLLLLLVLSVRVVRLRRRHHVAFGDGEVGELACAIRAFGNAAEYVPTGLVALVALAFAGADLLMIHAAGLMLFAGRIAHAVGLSRSGAPSRLRAAGVVATWIAYLLAGVGLLVYAVP